MVRIVNRQYHQAYDYIKEDSSRGNCIIFVASDVDSICAVRIFQSLLKSDIIPHKIVPLSGYKDLERANTELIEKDTELKSIVMINCGGIVDIYQYLQVEDDVKIYIIDSHRPLNLDNLHESKRNVCVFDDNDETEKLTPVLEAFSDLMYAEEESEEEEEEEEEESDEDRDNDEEDNDDDDEGGGSRIKRRKLNENKHESKKMSRLAKRAERRRQNRLLADYYTGGMYYSNSISGMVYELSNQLNKSTNELLWAAIVGVTAQYVFERIDTQKYLSQLAVFKADRERLDTAPQQNNNSNNDDNMSQNNNKRTANITIKAEVEYRFMMFRHWSLYDSMYHSGYVSSKLGVWKEAGKKRLNNMFAKMGFSLQQCQQTYTHMDMDLKQMLHTKIEVVAPLYGLTDICFPSFTRHYGYEYCLSASDVVYALATLLETSPAAATRLGETVEWNEEEDWGSLDNTQEEDAMADGLGSVRRVWWMRNFYTAYDALGASQPDLLMHGLRLCMKIQKVVVEQGADILVKRMAKSLNNFRFVNIRNSPDLPIFQHPLTLSKLASFLIDAYREHGKKNLPFVISSLDAEHGTSLILATTGAPTFGDVRKNTFGLAFQEAAEKTGARISFDSFETFVVQVHENDIDHFVEKLYFNPRQ